MKHKKKRDDSAIESHSAAERHLVTILHVAFGLWLIYWYRAYATDLWVASVDLPGHVTVIERLREHLFSFRLRFFDPHWFSGWPAFQFYAPLSHLLAALISVPLGIVSNEPARLSAHLILLSCLAGLPWAIHRFCRELLKAICTVTEQELRRAELPLAGMSIMLGFWYLNHDHQWYGVGAAAALHVGLFSQIVAWQLLLGFLTALVCLLRRPAESLRPVALWFAALFLCHSLTAFFGLFVVAVVFCLFAERRAKLFLAIGLSFVLSSFWFVPFQLYSAEYTGLDIYRPTGDFLELFFRYPLHGILQSLSAWGAGAKFLIEITNLIVMLLALGALLSTKLHSSRVYVSFLVVLLLGLVVFSSGFIASSIPLGLHYYRFYAYLFLLLVLLLVVVPLPYFVEKKRPTWTYIGIVGVVLLSLISNVNFPHYERDEIQKLRGDSQFANEIQLLAYLQREPSVGRVYFSYFADYDTYPFLSAHFLTSQLYKRNGQDTLNGLFIQSSLAYRMPVASAVLLGVPGYHIPLLFTDNAKISEEVALRQLLDVGITHIVLGAKNLKDSLKRVAAGRIHFVGPYAIVPIASQAAPLIRVVQKPLIGYYDFDKTVPFSMFEMYFYSRGGLYSAFELVELDPDSPVPPQTVGVVVNSMRSEAELRAHLGMGQQKLLRFSHTPHYALDHYSVWYQHNVELDAFKSIEKTLNEMGLQSQLLSLPRTISSPVVNQQPALTARDSWQSLELSGLIPGVLYSINLSYFPYWSADGGVLYRGMPERILFTAQSETAVLSYSMFSRTSTWIGYALSLIGLLCILPVSAKRLTKVARRMRNRLLKAQ
jgi:hypothetical protein